MRKLTLFICGVFILGTSMMGEEKSSKALKNELSFGLGTVTFTEIAEVTIGFAEAVGLSGIRGVESSTPAFFISYMQDISKRVSVGALIFYQEFTYKEILFWDSTTTYGKEIILGFYPKLRIYYSKSETARLYGDIGLGVGFQITLLGVDFMVGKNVILFLKSGIGMEGLISGGISYRF